jgi:hypothetical protein
MYVICVCLCKVVSKHILCCAFLLFFFVLCSVLALFVLALCIMYPILPVYCVPYITSFTGLSIFCCPFGILQRLFNTIIYKIG